jgi:dihydroorotate dehydrogenase
MSLYALARPLLFTLDPERAHDLTLASLDAPGACVAVKVAAGPRVDDAVDLLGLRFANRVGLAAGLDKNAAHVGALAAMGFGFLEVGTVTPKPQPGNPRPRMFRLPERSALINRLGFNNGGLDAFVANVERQPFEGVLGLNIGKNADTPIERATDDYLIGLRRVWPHASYVTVNISSPNTRNLRQLQGGDELTAMLAALGERLATLKTEALALAELEHAPVSTLHGLCRRILAEQPIEAGADFQAAELVSTESLLDELSDPLEQSVRSLNSGSGPCSFESRNLLPQLELVACLAGTHQVLEGDLV